MTIPAAATQEGATEGAVTGDPEAEVVREVEEVAGILQRPGDRVWDGLAMLELRARRT